MCFSNEEKTKLVLAEVRKVKKYDCTKEKKKAVYYFGYTCYNIDCLELGDSGKKFAYAAQSF